MSIKVFRDQAANAIFVESDLGGRFLNSLQAYVNDAGNVSVCDLTRSTAEQNYEEMSDVAYTEFVDELDAPYGADAQSTVNALNAVFGEAGSSGSPPTITSPTTINAVTGEQINYELTSNGGVAHEWVSGLPTGLTTLDGNVRKVIGSISTPGTYTPTMRAVNYFGDDTQTLTINVSTPAFSNTKSVRFDSNKYLKATASLLDSAMGRAGNGSGAADAWSISFYFNVGGSSNENQTIFYFGSSDVTNGNHIMVKYNGDNSSRRQVILRYGSVNNNLTLKTPVGTHAGADGWKHYLITYDGGTTGASSGDISDYYSRFKIFVDGVQQSTVNSNSNYGNTTALSGQSLKIGKLTSGGHMRSGCKLDEFAIWDSDQSANVSSIYNSGTPFDLSTLGTQPKHWWRMGDGDTYPNLQDSGTAANCTFVMYSMTAADLVNDVPT